MDHPVRNLGTHAAVFARTYCHQDLRVRYAPTWVDHAQCQDVVVPGKCSTGLYSSLRQVAGHVHIPPTIALP